MTTTSDSDRPPRLARWLLRRMLDGPARSAIIGDLDEEFARFIVPQQGLRRARRWYWRQTALSLGACLKSPSERRTIDGEPASAKSVILQDSRGLMTDVAAAMRLCTRRPLVSIVIVLTLALGIGASTAVFSVVNALYLKKLPIANADRIVTIASKDGESFTYPEYLASQAAAGLDALIAGGRIVTTLGDGRDRRRVSVELVTGNYFDSLGVGAASRGRLFHPDDDSPGRPPVAIASEAFWRDGLKGDPMVVGRTIRLHWGFYTVAGVAPQGFAGTQAGFGPDFWVPLTQAAMIDKHPDLLGPRTSWLGLLGVLTRDTSPAVVRTNLFARWRDRGTLDDVIVSPIASGEDWFVPQRDMRLKVLGIFVAVTLVIACLNVSTLLGAGIHARQKELAIRSTLGAGRLRLVRQLIVEHVVLAGAGGVIGGVLGIWLSRGLVTLLANDFSPEDLDVRVDLTVIAFITGVSLLTGIGIGAIPSLRWSRVSSLATLQGGATGGLNRMLRSIGWLIPWQVALGTVLLASGGLLLQTVHQLKLQIEQASPDRVWFAGLDFDEMLETPKSFGDFVERMRTRMQASPDAEAVGLSTLRPLAAISRGPVSVEGLDKPPASRPVPFGDWGPPPPPPPKGAVKLEKLWIVSNSFVTPGFFRALGLPIVQGRDFTTRDIRESPHVAIVNQTFATRAFGSTSAIGKRIGVGAPGGFDTEIVGVVRDLRYEHLRDAAPDAVFFPLSQIPPEEALTPTATPGRSVPRDLTLVVRAREGARPSAEGLRQQVMDVDARPLVDRVWTFDEEAGQTLSHERLLAWLGSVLGSVALLLLVIGLYGTMSASVIRARRELGIRLALGASPGSLGGMVVRRSLFVVAAGFALGLPLSYAATKYFAHLLYGVHAGEPLVAGVVAVILLLTAAIAAYLPARQAARVDPVVALRAE
jgi:putative ABC transport system permease protein